jgi:radical SAM family protein
MNLRRVTFNIVFRLVAILRDLRGLAAPSFKRVVPPTDVNLEPSNLCNADCVFCGYQFQERPHNEISIELGRKIVLTAKREGAKRLGLTPVVGEPLVSRRLEGLIRLAAQPPQPLLVGLTTNGILLTRARYQALVEAGVHSICISMTYPDEDEYVRIYRNKGLKRLVANLQSILDIYGQYRCEIALSIRTPRRDWYDHPLFVRARAAGWNVSNNKFFDDWSGRTASIMEAEGLWRRPNRAKVLPCSMLYSGPHFFSDGRATACGCRDLDGKSDLALDPQQLFSGMRQVYADGAIERIRERFRAGDPPTICTSCRHYNPYFEGEALGTRLRQLVADAGLVGSF